MGTDIDWAKRRYNLTEALMHYQMTLDELQDKRSQVWMQHRMHSINGQEIAAEHCKQEALILDHRIGVIHDAIDGLKLDLQEARVRSGAARKEEIDDWNRSYERNQ